jgi:hypothetical protein
MLSIYQKAICEGGVCGVVAERRDYSTKDVERREAIEQERLLDYEYHRSHHIRGMGCVVVRVVEVFLLQLFQKQFKVFQANHFQAVRVFNIQS